MVWWVVVSPTGDDTDPPGDTRVAPSGIVDHGDTKPTGGNVSVDEAITSDVDLRDDALSAIEYETRYNTLNRATLEGMAPADTPEGIDHFGVFPSPNGKYLAFVSGNFGESMAVIVRDLTTGRDVSVPAPDADLPEMRSVRGVAWDSNGQTLYVAEDLAHDDTLPDDIWSRTPAENHQLMTKAEQKPQVLSQWKVDTDNANIVDQFEKSTILAMDTDAGGVTTVHQTDRLSDAPNHGWGYVEVRRHDDAGVTSRTVRIARKGQTVDYHRPRLLADKNELWFLTFTAAPDHGGERSRSKQQLWLASMDLSQDQPEARLRIPDVQNFVWSADEDRIVLSRIDDDAARSGKPVIDFEVRDRRDFDNPRRVASTKIGANDTGLGIAGLDAEGDTLYLQALAKQQVTRDELNQPGTLQLYTYPVGQ
ncbi:MAG: hypothetical protein AAF333_11555 [Planctomycetota bacterium]